VESRNDGYAVSALNPGRLRWLRVRVAASQASYGNEVRSWGNRRQDQALGVPLPADARACVTDLTT
jgi:hypothetical protein